MAFGFELTVDLPLPQLFSVRFSADGKEIVGGGSAGYGEGKIIGRSRSILTSHLSPSLSSDHLSSVPLHQYLTSTAIVRRCRLTRTRTTSTPSAGPTRHQSTSSAAHPTTDTSKCGIVGRSRLGSHRECSLGIPRESRACRQKVSSALPCSSTTSTYPDSPMGLLAHNQVMVATSSRTGRISRVGCGTCGRWRPRPCATLSPMQPNDGGPGSTTDKRSTPSRGTKKQLETAQSWSVSFFRPGYTCA